MMDIRSWRNQSDDANMDIRCFDIYLYNYVSLYISIYSLISLLSPTIVGNCQFAVVTQPRAIMNDRMETSLIYTSGKYILHNITV